MEKIHSITGGGGLALHVREWGDPHHAPILLIHGWSQNHLCWRNQYYSFLADDFRFIALDLRGHGMSDAPHEVENYTDGRLWADDIAAIIETLGLVRPVLVGWSYGGTIINDYVRIYGQSAISGINYVGSLVTLTEETLTTFFGHGFLDNVADTTASDLPTNIQAMKNILRACFIKRIPREDFLSALAFSVFVSPQVRGALLARTIESDDVLSDMTVPVLVSQGTADILVLPSMAEHILRICPTAEGSWYKGTGHAPFLEDPKRFNEELASFVRKIR